MFVCCYHYVVNKDEYIYNTGVCDGQTPHDGKDRAMQSVARVKMKTIAIIQLFLGVPWRAKDLLLLMTIWRWAWVTEDSVVCLYI